MDKYVINDEFSGEILQKIMLSDDGDLFFSALSLENLPLFNQEQIDVDMSNGKNTCEKYTIAKQYIDEDELNEDNKKTIYFDRKMDSTRYEILLEFRGQTNKEERLKQHLKDVVGLDNFEEEAAAILAGKREVMEGHYAIIIDDEDGSKKYYKRQEGKWVIAPKMKECNLQKKCVEFKEGCKDFDAARDAIKNKQMEKIIDYFSEKHELSMDRMKQKLEKDIRYYSDNINRKIFLNHQEKIKYDIKKYSLGLNSISDTEFKESPRLALLHSILGQSDFVKKQSDIIAFVKKYCREHNQNEPPFWYYCVQTDTPLIPSFFKELAEAYENKTYKKVLGKVISEQGSMSDDGGYVIDKHSGYIIQYIHFDTSEGYDDGGFKMVSRDIMEEKKKKATVKRYASAQSQMISNVIHTFCELMGFSVQEEEIISTISELLKKDLPSEAKYKKAKRASKGKMKLTFKEFHDDTLLIYTVCLLIIYVQTVVPSIITNTSFPGCKKSFEGWPLFENDDFSTIRYFACALRQLKTSSSPWSSVSKWLGRKKKKPTEQIDKIMKKLKTYIEKKIVTHPYSAGRIQAKRNAYVEKKVKKISTEWGEFLPPLKNIKITNLRTISKMFIKSLMSDIKSGDALQFDKINVIKSKIYFFSLAIQEVIQKILGKEDPLLISSMQEPFLENACCNDSTNRTIDYFAKKEELMNSYNDTVDYLTNIINQINYTPNFIISKKDTKLTFPPISGTFSEKTIFSAFISFCKFNTKIPLSEEMIAICSKNTSAFNDNHDIDEKISILKKEGRTFTTKGLYALLKVKSSTINIQEETVSSIMAFRNHTDDGQLYNYMFNYADKFFQKKRVIDEETLRNYVLEENKRIKNKLKDFFKEFLSDSTKAETFIDTFMEWDERGNKLYMKSGDESAFFIRTFIQKMIRNIATIFPSMIINKVESTGTIPKHWKLSSIHVGHIQSIVRNDHFKKFFGNETITPTLEAISEKTKNICALSSITPFYADFEEEQVIFNGIVTKELYEYYLLRCLELHIEDSDDDDDSAYHIKTQVSELLFSYIEYMAEQKKYIQLNNEKITENILKSREKEKNIITTELKEMSIEEREVENLLKNHKLGKWAVGQSSAIHKYSQVQYEREIKNMEKQALMEHRLNKNDDVTNMNRDIYKDILHYEEETQQQVESELSSNMASIRGDDDLGDNEAEKIF